jgi:hypothetical protein
MQTQFVIRRVLLGLSLLTWKPIYAQSETSSQQYQSSKLRLKILEKGTGRPLGRAEVSVGETKYYSDGNGLVDIEAIGSDDVRIYRNSFEVYTLPRTTISGKTELTVYLFPATPDDNEVIIRGMKRPETSKKTISIEEAKKVAPGGDPAQIPKLLPGVQSNTIQPTIIVRGSGPFDSRYFIDDWSVPFIFHRIGNISIIPDQILSDVEFSSGGFGAQNGGATGGVVTLKTKNEIPARPKTEFRINVPVYSSVFHERAVDDNKAMVAVSARRSYLDQILPYVLPKDMNLTLVPYFGDAHVYYFRPTDDGYLKVLGLHAYDGLKLLFDTEFSDKEDGRGEFRVKDSTTLLGVERQKSLGGGWNVTISPQLSSAVSKTAIVGNRINLSADQASVSTEITKRFESKDKVYVGSELIFIEGKADVLAPKPQFDDPFFDFEEAPKASTNVINQFYSTSAWLIYDWNFDNLILTPGVRGNYSTQVESYYFDPRLNARFKVNEANAIKAAVGKYSQLPQFQQTAKVFGNPDLDVVKSFHYILGLETTWSDRWTTDFQSFYKETINIVRSDPVLVTNNKGSLISYGFEAFIRRNLTQKFFGWLAYTYSVNRERDNDQETYRNSQYDQTHVANLAGNYTLTATWDLGGRLIYHTGDTFSKVDGSVYNTNLDKYQPRTEETARVYNGRLPPYHELDVYADKAFLFDTWKMSLRFGIEYLAIEKQATSVQYNYDYSKEEYFRGLPPIPYIEVRGVL